MLLFSICLPLPMKETTTLMFSSVYCGKTFRSPDGLISSVGTTVSIQWLSYSASIKTSFTGTLKISISIGQPFDDCRTALHRDFYIIFNWWKCLVYINDKIVIKSFAIPWADWAMISNRPVNNRKREAAHHSLHGMQFLSRRLNLILVSSHLFYSHQLLSVVRWLMTPNTWGYV